MAGVTPFPFHQGLAQAAAIHICLTAVSIPNVLCRGEGTEGTVRTQWPLKLSTYPHVLPGHLGKSRDWPSNPGSLVATSHWPGLPPRLVSNELFWNLIKPLQGVTGAHTQLPGFPPFACQLLPGVPQPTWEATTVALLIDTVQGSQDPGARATHLCPAGSATAKLDH